LEENNKDDVWINKVNKELVRIRKTFLCLEDANDKWRIFLSQLSGDKLISEQDIYNRMVYDEQHFVVHMELARQLMDDIEIEIADISDEGSSQSHLSRDHPLHTRPAGNNAPAGPKSAGNNAPAGQLPAPATPLSPGSQLYKNTTLRNKDYYHREVSIPDFGDDFGIGEYLPIKIPPFNIPIFNGDPLSWPAFWQAFEASIDSLHIRPVQKYLT
jgi:hypothetical protein